MIESSCLLGSKLALERALKQGEKERIVTMAVAGVERGGGIDG
jgi:hypothetical protein